MEISQERPVEARKVETNMFEESEFQSSEEFSEEARPVKESKPLEEDYDE